MMPSTMACATCTPLGENSRASDCDSARTLNFPAAKAALDGPPFSEAVAPVKIRLGPVSAPDVICDVWFFKTCWAKRKAPVLSVSQRDRTA